MKRLPALVLGALLVAVAGFYYARGRAPAHSGRADQPKPSEMSLPELCLWITREYRADEGGWGTVMLDEAFARLAEAETAGKTRKIVDALQVLSENLLVHGRNDEAIEHLERAMRLAEKIDAPRPRLDGLRLSLGTAYLRRGETSHCISMHNQESCLFPISGGGVWADASAAEAAFGYFQEILEGSPESYSIRWLLNLAAMAAGDWPESVPEALRLPESVVSAQGDLPRFTDVASALGLATDDCAGGAILDDFDNDGLLDVVTSSSYPCEPLHYFHNQGGGEFELRVEEAGLAEQLGGLNCLQADYDGDGWLDVFVLRGAWMGRTFGRQRNSLLKNDGRGGFEDVTERAGVASAFPTQTAAWADYDMDGDLDLYIGNEAFPNELYQNRGDGTFEEVAVAAGVDGGRAFTKGVAWGDYDNDGDPDLYVSNWDENFFYRNEGDGTFREIGAELGVATHGRVGGFPEGARIVPGAGPGEDATFATWFFDYDNDGWLDLYVGGYNASLESVAADYLGIPINDPRRLRIYRNDGRGGFENAAAALGVDDVRLPMGANYGDVDNDGWLDFYLGTGQPRYEYLVPNVLYHSQAGRAFVDATISAGMGHLQKGHGVAFGDIDNDGDQDVFAQMGGFYPADAFRDALFLNPGTQSHWVTLVLRGAKANTRAVGARVEVAALTPSGERSIHLVAESGGSFGASSLQQEVGLGDALHIARVTVRWPAGATEIFEGLPLDRSVELSEGRAGFRVLERPLLSFGQ